jgi:undecaprenyl-diphosphatase
MIMRLKAWWRQAGDDAPYLLAGAIAFCLACWVLAEMTDDAVPGNYLPLETQILRAFRQPDNPAIGIGPAWLPSMVRDITALGSVADLALLDLLVIGLLLLRHRVRTAALILFATVGGVLVSNGLKSAVHRERPHVVPHLMDVSSQSFPSGHSMMSSVVYLTLGALLAQTMARRREKFYLIGAALLLTVLVGVSRVYLGVHYPSDVLAGWAAGVAWALLCWGLAWWLQRRGQLGGPAE